MDENEVAEKVGAAITAIMCETGNATIKWSTTIDVLDPSGERILYTLAPDGQPSWDTLSLLAFHTSVELSNP